jgi:hypothetical protein
MNNDVAVNLNNPTELRKKGIEALTSVLGPVGMARFLQQYDMGHGNYTEERHAYLDNVTAEDFDKMLEEYDIKH